MLLGIPLNSYCSEQYCPSIHHLARIGDIEKIQDILSNNPETVNEPDTMGKTALFYAISSGNPGLVSLLLDNGANPNYAKKEYYTETALMEAVYSGNKEIIDLLSNHDLQESINIPDETGQTILFHAINKNDKDLVEKLLSKGASIEYKSDYFGTPLMVASKNNNQEMVALLLNHGANPNTADASAYFETPLIYAIQYNNKQMVSDLLKSKADVKKRDRNGHLPIRRAANHIDSLESLQDENATGIFNLLMTEHMTELAKNIAYNSLKTTIRSGYFFLNYVGKQQSLDESSFIEAAQH